MKCSNCYTPLIITSAFTKGYNGYYYHDFIGCCPICNKHWSWSNVYEYIKTTTSIEPNSMEDE